MLPGAPGNVPSVINALDRFGMGRSPARAILDEIQSGNADKKRPPPSQRRIQVGSEKAQSFVEIQRRPFVLTCQQWIEEGRYIYCRVNPRSAVWTMPLRKADQLTMAGTVQHTWRQQLSVNRSSYFGEPEIAFTFQSGNIMPVRPDRYIDPARPRAETSLPRGLDNYYAFKELLNQPAIVNDATGDRRANVVYIMYTSQVYPSIVLTGMFKQEGLSTADTAEDPNRVEWNATFTVFDSFPRFDRYDELVQSWRLADLAPTKGAPDTNTANQSGQVQTSPVLGSAGTTGVTGA